MVRPFLSKWGFWLAPTICSTTMSIDRESLEKVPASPVVDEKQAVDTETVSVLDSVHGDEALELVGHERTAEFSEEYNRRLRRKLVRVCRPLRFY